MSKIDEIRQKLKDWANNGGIAPTMLATVLSVDEDAKTCVLVDDGVEYPDVRLTPVLADGEAITIFPKVGTWCLAVRIENDVEWLPLAFQEVVKYRLKIGTTVFEVTADGVKISKGSDSLKSCMDDLINQVKLITVTCAAAGTPSTTPLNAAAFTALKTRIDNILK